MVFRVKVTLKAERDLEGILAWLLAEGAGETGLRWFSGLKRAINTLTVLPTRCPLALENAMQKREVRQLLYGSKPSTYRVLFTIHNDVVVVLHVRGPRQNPAAFH